VGELQGRFESNLPTFFNREGFVANDECRICGLEKSSVDVIRLIKDHLLKSRDLKALQAANG
jgi:hypothetical protein